MATDLEITPCPLKPQQLAEQLRAIALECRATLEHSTRLDDPQLAAVDLVADLAEETALWLEHGTDPDAAPTLAIVLTIAALHPVVDRRCRECGCTDRAACVTTEGPCHWLETFGDGTGICSAHPRAA